MCRVAERWEDGSEIDGRCWAGNDGRGNDCDSLDESEGVWRDVGR